MTRIRAVLFDCDGVVVDSGRLQVEAEQQTADSFAEEHGLDYDPEAHQWGTMAGWARRKIAGTIFGIEADSDLADQYRQAVVATTGEIICEDNAPLVPGVRAFIGHLDRRGIKRGLATNSHRDIYTSYCRVSAGGLFLPQHTVTWGEAVDDKPEPGPWHEVMHRLDVAPEETAIIEDSASGITSIRRSGALAIGIATTRSRENLLTQTGAHLVAEGFEEAAYLLDPLLARH